MNRLLLISLVLTACEPEPRAPHELVPGNPQARYDQTLQSSAHNAFERDEPLLDQLIYDRVRSLELDLHSSKEWRPAPGGEWFVYHEDLPLNRETSCNTLSDCLRLLAAFHRAVPRHEAVTVWLDLKFPFEPGHDAADLDAALFAALGRDNVLTPADLMARCPGAADLRAAVTGSCHFPTLAELRGKFLFGMTGGTSCSPNDAVPTYGGATPRERAAFLAPGIDGSCPVESYDARRDVVMLNMVFEQHEHIAEVRSRGLIARVYRGLLTLNNSVDFATVRADGANHIAMDMLNIDRDPWASTQNAVGFPFACDGCGPPLAEDAAVVGVRASTGDLGSTSDDFVLASADGQLDETWSALVSVPSSHVDGLAKGCLVARADASPGAPSVAVCRFFDGRPPAMIFRTAAGGDSTTLAAPTDPEFRAETAAFLQLELTGGLAIARASIDGVQFVEVGRVTVTQPLPLRGLGVTSHSGPWVKALFTDVSRGGAPLKAGALSLEPIGPAATGELFDGVTP